jgi:hypothetical protein
MNCTEVGSGQNVTTNTSNCTWRQEGNATYGGEGTVLSYFDKPYCTPISCDSACSNQALCSATLTISFSRVLLLVETRTKQVEKFLTIKPTRCTNFSNLFLEWNSTCFGQLLCPSSGVFHCTHSNVIWPTSLLTACEQDQDEICSLNECGKFRLHRL